MAFLLSSHFSSAAILGALAAWLSFAVSNNIRDPGTNRFLLEQMFRMDLLRDDPELGRGIAARAWTNPAAARNVLRLVVIVQVMIAALLWTATVAQLGAGFSAVSAENALLAAHVALVAFLLLWTAFLCGGMWFGYWMKSPQIQQVHLALFMISIVALIAVT